MNHSHEILRSLTKERLESPNLKKIGPTHHLYTDTPPTQTQPNATSSLQGKRFKIIILRKIFNIFLNNCVFSPRFVGSKT